MLFRSEDFLADKPRALERGYYSRFLRRYLRLFDRNRMLVLVFEEAVKDVRTTKGRLADFLGVDAERFPAGAGSRKVNPSSVPRLQFLYGLVAQTGRRFRKWHLEPVVDFVMRTSIPRMLANGTSLPSLDRRVKERLSERYRDEFRELEECLHIDLSVWRA